MKKKFLLSAGTAILALGVLTACGDKPEEDANQPDGTPGTEQQDDVNNETETDLGSDSENEDDTPPVDEGDANEAELEAEDGADAEDEAAN